MSGAYTHISIVNDARVKASGAGLRKPTLKALGLYLKYVELGAMSPDYPYLDLALDRKQTVWADLMHYTSTARLVQSGVKEVCDSPGAIQPKLTAWLLGLAAHIATDMTIHPVIELKVGPYKGNESEHRRCEMHQDAYIFPKVMNVGPTNLSEHMASGIGGCSDPSDGSRLDPDVERIWSAMLNQTYPGMATKVPAQPSSWHRGFKGVLLTLSKVNQLVPFSRHVSANLGLTYPQATDIDHSYIANLRTPEGVQHFDEVYERARNNVLAVWKGLDDALAQGGSSDLDSLENWNLDTGRSVATGSLVFWGVT
jgi:hypothetical protein